MSDIRLYRAEERAFAPGIVTDWPKVWRMPRRVPNGRLVAVSVQQVIDELRGAGYLPADAMPCVWTEDITGDFWESACGETWTFIDGGPAENKARFCHGCGHPIEAVAHIDSIEEGEEA